MRRTVNSFLNDDRWWLLVLLVAALLLYEVNLGSLPLRDWDEATIASVARNIWQGSPDSHVWLYPTIDDQPYWNKPPLIHWAIAISYRCFGVSEWSTRLIPATISAMMIPLIYAIGRAIFANRLTAILAALIYLTLLPVARHGRMAMLDGAIVCWFCLAVWCLLKGRFDRRFLLGVGVSLGLICLTKGIALGVLLGGILALFIVWDSPRIITSPYLIVGLILGLIPAIAWYGLQYLHYGKDFIGINLGTQTFGRILAPLESHQNPVWYYLLEITKYSLPWLLFLPSAIALAKNNYRWSWAKLTLVWSGVYLLAVSAMATKLPWYIMPIYPALALFIAVNLTRIWQFPVKYYSPVDNVILGLVAIAGWVTSIYYFWSVSDRDLGLLIAGLALTLTVATILRFRKSRYFIVALIGGLYLVFLLFFNSSYWIWELAEAYPVKPVAAEIESQTAPGQIIYTSFPYFRPSLNFYSERVIIPASEKQLRSYWSTKPATYLLVDTSTIDNLHLTKTRTLASIDNWRLIANY
jgi:4-amino-4-deoxy-L-arabinose transferase-like glycosyltransferase